MVGVRGVISFKNKLLKIINSGNDRESNSLSFPVFFSFRYHVGAEMTPSLLKYRNRFAQSEIDPTKVPLGKCELSEEVFF